LKTDSNYKVTGNNGKPGKQVIMKITRDNYEGFLLDHAEGQLSVEQEDELLRFMAENPDLEICPDDSMIRLPVPVAIFPLKEDMKKGGLNGVINRSNFGQFYIARMEGDLDPSGERDLETFIDNNPDLAGEAAIYRSLILKPDKNIQFPAKQSLRKRKGLALKLFAGNTLKRDIYRVLSVAASIAVLISAGFFVFNQSYRVKPANPYAVENNSLLQETVTDMIAEDASETDASVTVIAEGNIVSTISSDSDVKRNSTEVLSKHSDVLLSDQLTTPRDEILPVIRPIVKGIVIESGNPPNDPGIVKLAGHAIYPPRAGQNGRYSSPVTISGVVNLLARSFSDTGRDRERDGINFMDLADAGVKGINSLAGTDLRFEREYNLRGELVSLAFTSRTIEIQRTSSIIEE
jgi:hypothetical protein